MKTIETKKQKIEGNETKDKLNELQNESELYSLKKNVESKKKIGKFEHVRNSNNGEYSIYSYIIINGGTAKDVKNRAIKENLANNKQEITITDKHGKIYPESKRFPRGEKIYVKILRKKYKETSKEKSETNNITIEKHELHYLHRSNNKKYDIYTYINRKSGITAKDIQKAVEKTFNINSGVLVTNKHGDPYKKSYRFSRGEKIYIKILSNKELKEEDIKIIDGMKCKGGEYFGIDVSKFNTNMNLEDFKKWNREKWDTEKSDSRGVSFMYIRAGDGSPKDQEKDEESLEKRVNFVQDYNNDKTIKNNYEQISVGFYWRLSLNKNTTGESEAKKFLSYYNKYINKIGKNQLVPMLDLETDSFNISVKQTKEKALKWLKYIEKETGIIPGIYIGAQAYGNYIINDHRFDKYLTWITAYPDTGSNGREKGNARRINFKEGSVKVGGKKNRRTTKPNMYQSSQEGTVPGTSAPITEKDKKTYQDTDMDHTKDITKLFSKNNKSK